MASTSRPNAANPSVSEGQPYEQWAHPLAPDGLIGHPDDSALVYADGTGTRQVKIRAGKYAQVRGRQYESGPSDFMMPSLASNTSGQTRVDLIVLRYSRADYTVKETAIPGTPGAGAPSPTYQTGTSGFFDLPVAEVTVDSGVSAIAAAKVKPVAWYIGEDGQLLGTSKIPRPPHAPARVITETDTGRQYVSISGTWRTVTDDSGNTAVTMETGWTASVNRLRRRNGVVQLDLTVRGPGVAAGGTVKVAKLPSGFAPATALIDMGMYWSGGGSVGLKVATNGDISLNAPGGVQINSARDVEFHTLWFV